MNLISCGHCGVLLDKDRIPESEIQVDDNDEYVAGTYAYAYIDNDEFKNFHALIKCPACKKKIIYRNGDAV